MKQDYPWRDEFDRPAHPESKHCSCASCEGARAGAKLGKAVAKIIIKALDKAGVKRHKRIRSAVDKRKAGA